MKKIVVFLLVLASFGAFSQSKWYNAIPDIRAVVSHSLGDAVGLVADSSIYSYSSTGTNTDDGAKYLKPFNVKKGDPGRWTRRVKPPTASWLSITGGISYSGNVTVSGDITVQSLGPELITNFSGWTSALGWTFAGGYWGYSNGGKCTLTSNWHPVSNTLYKVTIDYYSAAEILLGSLKVGNSQCETIYENGVSVRYVRSMNTTGIVIATEGPPSTIRSISVRAVLGGEIQATGLNVMALPVFTDNALAQSAGLFIGEFYRTGGDPDLICVVH